MNNIKLPSDIFSVLERNRAYLTSEIADKLAIKDSQARNILNKELSNNKILKHKFGGRTYWAIKPGSLQ
jgi:hypothetical protein